MIDIQNARALRDHDVADKPAIDVEHIRRRSDERLNVAVDRRSCCDPLQELPQLECRPFAPVLPNLLFLLIDAIVKFWCVDSLQADLDVSVGGCLTHDHIDRRTRPVLVFARRNPRIVECPGHVALEHERGGWNHLDVNRVGIRENVPFLSRRPELSEINRSLDTQQAHTSSPRNRLRTATAQLLQHRPPCFSCRCISLTVRSVIAASVSVGLAVAPVANTLEPAMKRFSWSWQRP